MRWLPITLALSICASLSAQEIESVSIVRFEQVMQTQAREASARVESLDQAVIAAEVAARVIELPVRVGESIAAGDVLVELDPADYELALQSAQARLEVARAAEDMARLRAERARRLAPEQFVSDDQLLEAETRLRQAQAEHAAAQVEIGRAELMLARTRITSPYDAVVQARLIGVGALAAPGTPLVEVVALERLEVSSGVALAQVDGLLASQGIEFIEGERAYPLRVLRVSPLVSPGSRQREVRLEFIDQRPPPGSQGVIAWVDPRPVLPADFVMTRNGELGVLLVDSDQTVGATAVVRWQPLPQADAGRPVQVDLPMDALLIDEGRRRVQPRQSVQITAESL